VAAAWASVLAAPALTVDDSVVASYIYDISGGGGSWNAYERERVCVCVWWSNGRSIWERWQVVTKDVTERIRSTLMGPTQFAFFLDHPIFLGHRPPCLGCIYL
jgi:hypothetical protein